MSTSPRRRRPDACRCVASTSTSAGVSTSPPTTTAMGTAPMDKNRGFTLIEVLISMLIMAIGLLGLAGMQAVAQRAEVESYQRAQALVLVQDMVDRINSNRKAAGCYAFTPMPDTGAVYAGTAAAAPTCTGAFGTTQTRAQADADMLAWHNLLKGSAETLG